MLFFQVIFYKLKNVILFALIFIGFIKLIIFFKKVKGILKIGVFLIKGSVQPDLRSILLLLFLGLEVGYIACWHLMSVVLA